MITITLWKNKRDKTEERTDQSIITTEEDLHEFLSLILIMM